MNPADNTRETLANTLIPLISHFSGTARSTAERNGYFVSKSWFLSFGQWLKQPATPYPGKITNGKLSERIAAKEPLIEGEDFETLESNVWKSIYPIFQGGPIIRPFLNNSVTHQSYTIVYPIKLTIIFERNEIVKTIDPNWNYIALKTILASKLKIEPLRSQLHPPKTADPIPDLMLMHEAVSHFGTIFEIEPPLSGAASLFEVISLLNPRSTQSSSLSSRFAPDTGLCPSQASVRSKNP